MTRTETVIDYAFIHNLLNNDLPPVTVAKKGKKTVTFSRRDLEKVRYFRTEEPVWNLRTQQEQAKDVIPFYQIRSAASRFGSMSDISRAIQASPNVALDNVVLRYPFLDGYVFVRNICFQKRVALRYSLDGWKTSKDLEARYDSSHQFANLDRFCFSLEVSALFAGEGETEMQFAVWFDANGTQFWDNNGGKNYSVQFIKKVPTPPAPVKSPLSPVAPVAPVALHPSPVSILSTISSSSPSSSSSSSQFPICLSPLSISSSSPSTSSSSTLSFAYSPISFPVSSSPPRAFSSLSLSSSSSSSSSSTWNPSSTSSSFPSTSSPNLAGSSASSSPPISIPKPRLTENASPSSSPQQNVFLTFSSSPHSSFLSSSPKTMLSSSPKSPGGLDSHYLDQYAGHKRWEASI